MNFNVNELLSSLSFTLDCVEGDLINNVSNHGRRVAYIAARIGEKLNFSDHSLFDLISYSLLHDNGVTKSLIQAHGHGSEDFLKAELSRMHCVEGEKNIKSFPFFSSTPNVLLYHHEHYDGSGFFELSGKKIPLYSRIISLSDTVAVEYSEQKSASDIINTIKNSAHLFDPNMSELFFELSRNIEFWLNMNDAFVDKALGAITPYVNREFNYQNMRDVSQIFCDIIDAKSPFTVSHSRRISEKAGKLCEYYKFDQETYWKMRIAADLHDLEN